MKTILITGATAGFGKATAQKFAENGYRVIITGRRTERLTELKTELEGKHGVQVLPLTFDVRDLAQVKAAVSSIPENWRNIDILVNNAGLASGMGPIDEGDTDDWDVMIDTNVKGLLYTTKEVLPLLKTSDAPHIVNIGSTAGKDYYAGGNVYCATKHAVDALTRTMRVDLLPHGVKVTGICPGLAETEFSMVRFKGDEAKAKTPYEGLTPIYAEDIAEIIYFAATRPAHVNLNDIVITCTEQADSYYTVRNNRFKKPSV